jgi:hypothetical protein
VDDRLPPLLTVEEAAKLLRIGRTKAYALAQEWRTTGGRSGLPVVDFGHVLRVPLCQLEQLVGGHLTAPPVAPPSSRATEDPGAHPAVPSVAAASEIKRQHQMTKTTRNRNDAQLSLIEPAIND